MSTGRPPFTDKELEYLKKNYIKANTLLSKEMNCSVSMIKDHKYALKHGITYKEKWKEDSKKVPTNKYIDTGGRDKEMRSYAKELGYTLPQALGHFGKYKFIRMFKNQTNENTNPIPNPSPVKLLTDIHSK